MSISIGQWHEEIGNFNCYKCNSSPNTEHSKSAVNFCFCKLIFFICLCYMHDFLNNCNCYLTNSLNYLLIFLSIINFKVQVLTPIIVVYKSFKTKLVRSSYFLQCCLILNYFIVLSLNLILQHGDMVVW